MTYRNSIFLAAACAATYQADAISFRLPNQDPEAIARGNAFVATANNPSAIYYNPAGITQLEGHQISLGAYFVSAGTDFSSPVSEAETDTSFQPVPQLYYVFSPQDSKLSYGLGIYAPYGLGLDWGRNTQFSLLGEEGKLLYATINPVIAWQVHETFSIGFGPTLNYSQADLRTDLRPLRLLGLDPTGMMDQFRFKGDGFAAGFNAGLRWQPHEKWAFGLSYRFTTEVDYDGHSEYRPLPRTDTKAELTFPQFVVAGVSFRPNDKWNLEVNIDWTDWDNVNATEFRGALIPRTLVFDHVSSFMYEFGVTRQLPKNYFVSAGYFFSENSVPDETFNPLIPDSDLHLGSVGFGHKGERWDWAFAYHFGYNGEGGRLVTGSPLGLADGRYKTLNHGLNVSTVFKF